MVERSFFLVVTKQAKLTGPNYSAIFLDLIWLLLIIVLLVHADMHIAQGQIVSKPSKHLVRYEEKCNFLSGCFNRTKEPMDGPFVFTNLSYSRISFYDVYLYVLMFYRWTICGTISHKNAQRRKLR